MTQKKPRKKKVVKKKEIKTVVVPADTTAKHFKGINNKELKFVAVSDIELSDDNDRSGDDKTFPVLLHSIDMVGILQPVVLKEIIKPTGSQKYRVLAGNRRILAAKVLKLESVPAMIIGSETLISDKTIEIYENVIREDISVIDEANSILKLSKQNISNKAIAVIMGRDVSYIEHRLSLLNLIPEAMNLFLEEAMPIEIAIKISRMDSEFQKRCIDNYSYKPKVIAENNIEIMSSFIRNRKYKQLSSTAFDKKDSNLVKNIPSCIDCPKRTGFNPDLFNDVKGTDYCTDKVCLMKKANKHLSNVLKELDEKKTKYVKISDSWTGGEDVYKEFDYMVVKKGTPKSTLGIIVNGISRGRKKYIKIIKKSDDVQSGMELLEKDKRTSKQKKSDSLAVVREIAIRDKEEILSSVEIVKNLKENIKIKKEDIIDVIAALFYWVEDVEENIFSEIMNIGESKTIKDVSNLYNDTPKLKKYLEQFEERKLLVMMVLMVNSTEGFVSLVKKYSVDVKGIREKNTRIATKEYEEENK